MASSMWVFPQLVPARVKKTSSVQAFSELLGILQTSLFSFFYSFSFSLICTRTHTHAQDEEYTMFLVAGYARYSRPYVWIRSNHERLVQFNSDNKEEKDFPLQLKSTANWMEGGMFARCTTTGISNSDV